MQRQPVLTRRRALGLGAGLALSSSWGSAARFPLAFPRVEEIDSQLRAIAATSEQASLRTIGRSRMGRPIRMLTIGRGPRSALVVGGPHPNEPIGGASALALATGIARAPDTESYAPYTWHIVGSIDPDGLALNSSWLHGDHSLESYFLGFFRPAFEQQGEYSFPIQVGDYAFNSPTPENQAWQRALELTRPALQIGLHGADFGGAFYLLSEDVPKLRVALSDQPPKFGLTANTVGEPFAEFPVLGRGVFQFLDIAGMIAAQQKRGQLSWVAGDSSAYYARKHFGTFSVVSEVPAWDDARLRDAGPSPFTIGDVLARHRARLERLQSTVLPIYLELKKLSQPVVATILSSGLEEFARVLPVQLNETLRLAPLYTNKPPLSVREFAMYDTSLAFIGLRPTALLWRFATALSAHHPDAARAARGARKELVKGIAQLRAGADLRPVPVERMIDVQLSAIMTTAGILATD